MQEKEENLRQDKEVPSLKQHKQDWENNERD